MVNWSTFKNYFWSFFGVLGIVLFWAGVWDGLGGLPYLSNPITSLIVGIIILASSGLILTEFNPFSNIEKEVHTVLDKISRHPHKHEFHIKYYDYLKKKDVLLNAGTLKNIEKKAFLVLNSKGKELFVPVHRVTEILHKGKTHWKL